MKKFLLALLLVGIAKIELIEAQVVNNGALITIQSGAIVYANTSLTNQDNGMNNGIIDNSGTLTVTGNVLNTTNADFNNKATSGVVNNEGNFTNSNGATLSLEANSIYNIRGNWLNNATVTAHNDSEVEFRGTNQLFQRGPSGTSTGFGVVRVNLAAGTNTLTLDNSAGGVADLVVNKTLNLQNGIVVTTVGANRVDVTNRQANAIIGYVTPGTASTTRFINGELRRAFGGGNIGDYDFPVGSTTKNYQNLRVGVATAPANGTITVSFDPTLATINQDECSVLFANTYDNGRWIVSGSSYTTVSSLDINRLTLYPQASPVMGVQDRTVIRNNAIITSNGQPVGQTANPQSAPCAVLASTSDTQVPRANMNRIENGFYAAAYTTIMPFPVEFLYLKATPRANSIFLDWATASETNNAGFDLERSTDGINFSFLSFTPGNGTTQQTSYYNYDDQSVSRNVKYYYRVKQIDINGNFKYSNIVEGMLTDNPVFSASLYPNPTDGNLYLNISQPQEGTITVKFYNAIGQSVFHKEYELKAGTHQLDLSQYLEHLSNATYQAVISNGTDVISTKVVKLK
ncbi:MAG: T9SS type A sorting domain-containing protein [Bacteroidia bacterium]|nr:T9SS type A sorting domain-containing protein [Bacteroidia bacterium]